MACTGVLRECLLHFVTKEDCLAINTDFKNDLAQVKSALIGDDMRGGLVKDVTELKGSINEVKGSVSTLKAASVSRKDKAMIYVAIIASSGTIIVELIKALFS